MSLNEQGMLGQRLQGMGDNFDPMTQRIFPGSVRPPNPNVNEAGPALVMSPGAAQAESMIADFIRRYGGPPVVEVPMSIWQVNSYLLGVGVAILVDQPIRRDRRIVTVTNTSAANDVWVGPDSTTRVNFGEKIPPLGARSFPLTERVQIFAIGSAAGTIVSVGQFAT
jgi:hypothetical protein